MEYKIFRLTFDSSVHLGDGSLDGYSINLRADTVFSALCIEALKIGGNEALTRLVSYAQSGLFLISDAFPFIKNEYYFPKPFIRLLSGDDDGSPGLKKVYKKLKYIPLDMADDYFRGEFDANTVSYITGKLDEKLGKPYITMRAAVRLPDDALPYHVGIFSFFKDAGLYMIAGADKEALPLLRELFGCLSVAGVGGKRSSGLGRFSIEEVPVPKNITARLTGNYPAYMTLSVSLPDNNEIEKTLGDATYSLIRRSGFVFSENYADEPLRKNDLYVLDSGSVVKRKFDGGIYDVSNKGAHSVYRYAKPLFLGVSL